MAGVTGGGDSNRPDTGQGLDLNIPGIEPDSKLKGAAGAGVIPVYPESAAAAPLTNKTITPQTAEQRLREISLKLQGAQALAPAEAERLKKELEALKAEFTKQSDNLLYSQTIQELDFLVAIGKLRDAQTPIETREAFVLANLIYQTMDNKHKYDFLWDQETESLQMLKGVVTNFHLLEGFTPGKEGVVDGTRDFNQIPLTFEQAKELQHYMLTEMLVAVPDVVKYHRMIKLLYDQFPDLKNEQTELEQRAFQLFKAEKNIHLFNSHFDKKIRFLDQFLDSTPDPDMIIKKSHTFFQALEAHEFCSQELEKLKTIAADPNNALFFPVIQQQIKNAEQVLAKQFETLRKNFRKGMHKISSTSKLRCVHQRRALLNLEKNNLEKNDDIPLQVPKSRKDRLQQYKVSPQEELRKGVKETTTEKRQTSLLERFSRHKLLQQFAGKLDADESNYIHEILTNNIRFEEEYDQLENIHKLIAQLEDIEKHPYSADRIKTFSEALVTFEKIKNSPPPLTENEREQLDKEVDEHANKLGITNVNNYEIEVFSDLTKTIRNNTPWSWVKSTLIPTYVKIQARVVYYKTKNKTKNDQVKFEEALGKLFTLERAIKNAPAMVDAAVLADRSIMLDIVLGSIESQSKLPDPIHELTKRDKDLIAEIPKKLKEVVAPEAEQKAVAAVAVAPVKAETREEFLAREESRKAEITWIKDKLIPTYAKLLVLQSHFQGRRSEEDLKEGFRYQNEIEQMEKLLSHYEVFNNTEVADKLTEKLRDYYASINKQEFVRRANLQREVPQIPSSPEYLQLVEKIEALKAENAKLLANLSSSKQEVLAASAELAKNYALLRAELSTHEKRLEKLKEAHQEAKDNAKNTAVIRRDLAKKQIQKVKDHAKNLASTNEALRRKEAEYQRFQRTANAVNRGDLSAFYSDSETQPTRTRLNSEQRAALDLVEPLIAKKREAFNSKRAEFKLIRKQLEYLDAYKKSSTQEKDKVTERYVLKPGLTLKQNPSLLGLQNVINYSTQDFDQHVQKLEQDFKKLAAEIQQNEKLGVQGSIKQEFNDSYGKNGYQLAQEIDKLTKEIEALEKSAPSETLSTQEMDNEVRKVQEAQFKEIADKEAALLTEGAFLEKDIIPLVKKLNDLQITLTLEQFKETQLLPPAANAPLTPSDYQQQIKYLALTIFTNESSTEKALKPVLEDYQKLFKLAKDIEKLPPAQQEIIKNDPYVKKALDAVHTAELDFLLFINRDITADYVGYDGGNIFWQAIAKELSVEILQRQKENQEILPGQVASKVRVDSAILLINAMNQHPELLIRAISRSNTIQDPDSRLLAHYGKETSDTTPLNVFHTKNVSYAEWLKKEGGSAKIYIPSIVVLILSGVLLGLCLTLSQYSPIIEGIKNNVNLAIPMDMFILGILAGTAGAAYGGAWKPRFNRYMIEKSNIKKVRTFFKGVPKTSRHFNKRAFFTREPFIVTGENKNYGDIELKLIQQMNLSNALLALPKQFLPELTKLLDLENPAATPLVSQRAMHIFTQAVMGMDRSAITPRSEQPAMSKATTLEKLNYLKAKDPELYQSLMKDKSALAKLDEQMGCTPTMTKDQLKQVLQLGYLPFRTEIVVDSVTTKPVTVDGEPITQVIADMIFNQDRVLPKNFLSEVVIPLESGMSTTIQAILKKSYQTLFEQEFSKWNSSFKQLLSGSLSIDDPNLQNMVGKLYDDLNSLENHFKSSGNQALKKQLEEAKEQFVSFMVQPALQIDEGFLSSVLPSILNEQEVKRKEAETALPKEIYFGKLKTLHRNLSLKIHDPALRPVTRTYYQAAMHQIEQTVKKEFTPADFTALVGLGGADHIRRHEHAFAFSQWKYGEDILRNKTIHPKLSDEEIFAMADKHPFLFSNEFAFLNHLSDNQIRQYMKTFPDEFGVTPEELERQKKRGLLGGAASTEIHLARLKIRRNKYQKMINWINDMPARQVHVQSAIKDLEKLMTNLKNNPRAQVDSQKLYAEMQEELTKLRQISLDDASIEILKENQTLLKTIPSYFDGSTTTLKNDARNLSSPEQQTFDQLLTQLKELRTNYPEGNLTLSEGAKLAISQLEILLGDKTIKKEKPKAA